MANLVKELKKQAAETRKEVAKDFHVVEVQKLLMDKQAEDFQLFKDMGIASSIIQAQNIAGRKIELEDLDKHYGDVFTIEEIQSLCCKYALKFLRSDNYKGVLDPVLAQKIREFGKEKGVEINAATLGYRFFIMAPQDAFKLVEGPRKPAPDPAAFYKIDENHYRLLYKWGNDFSIMRRVLGFKYGSQHNYVLFFMLLLGVLPAAFFGYEFKSFFSLLAIPIAYIAGIVILSANDHKWQSWKALWNSNERCHY